MAGRGLRARHGLQPGRCGECRWLPWPLRPTAGRRAASSLGLDSSSYRFYRQDPRIWTSSLRALFILLHRARICFDNFCIKSNGAMVDEKRGSRYSRNTGLILNLNSRPCRTAQYADLVVPCALGLLSQSAICQQAPRGRLRLSRLLPIYFKYNSLSRRTLTL